MTKEEFELISEMSERIGYSLNLNGSVEQSHESSGTMCFEKLGL